MDLVCRSCYGICIYSVVDVCYILGLWRLRMLDWWIRLCLRCLRTNLKLLLILLLWVKLLRILLLLWLVWLLVLVLVLGELLAHDLSWLWRRLLLLRCQEIVLLWLRRITILGRGVVLDIKAGVYGLCRVNGIHCVNNAITTSVSALYRTDIRRWVTLRNAIDLLLLWSTLSLTVKRVHHDTGLNFFVR